MIKAWGKAFSNYLSKTEVEEYLYLIIVQE